MAQLTVHSEDLHDQSRSVKNGASEVNDTLSKLTNQISNLASRWEGGASDAFQSRWHEWQRGAESVKQAMEDMGTFLEQAAHAYEETEANLQRAAGH